MTSDQLARAAYAAYGATTDHLNYQGLPMPAFDDLGDRIQEAWRNAAAAVAPRTAHVASASCGHCGNQLAEVGMTITVDVDLGTIPQDIAAIRSEMKLVRADEQKEKTTMASIEDGLSEVEAAETAEEAVLATLSDDETRELADLQAIKTAGDTLTPEQQARFDALTAKITADTAAVQADDDAIDAADPAPVVTPPVDGGSTDGSGEAPVE